MAENGVILSSILLELNGFGFSILCVSFEDLNFVSHGVQVVHSARLAVLEGDDVSLSFPEPLQGLLKFVISLLVVVNLRVSSNLSVEVGKSLSLLFRNVILGAISLGSTLVFVLNRSDIPAIFMRVVLFRIEVEALEVLVGFLVKFRTIDIYITFMGVNIASRLIIAFVEISTAESFLVPFFVNGSNIFEAVEEVVIVAISRDAAEVSVMVVMTEVVSDVVSVVS